MGHVLRTIGRREKRILDALDAKGIHGAVAEMRVTWKRRSKKPPRKLDRLPTPDLAVGFPE